jgi:hypothetical protein
MLENLREMEYGQIPKIVYKYNPNEILELEHT